jgi:hypothetical protein
VPLSGGCCGHQICSCKRSWLRTKENRQVRELTSLNLLRHDVGMYKFNQWIFLLFFYLLSKTDNSPMDKKALWTSKNFILTSKCEI